MKSKDGAREFEVYPATRAMDQGILKADVPERPGLAVEFCGWTGWLQENDGRMIGMHRIPPSEMAKVRAVFPDTCKHKRGLITWNYPDMPDEEQNRPGYVPPQIVDWLALHHSM